VNTENKRHKILVSIVCYNSAENTKLTLNKVPRDGDYDVLIVDDGSVDRTSETIRESGFKFICHRENRGLGAAIKTGIRYGLKHGYDIFVAMAGNNKDDPRQIPRFLEAFSHEDVDFVQGSRFLEGGRFETPPVLRRILVKLYIRIFKLLTGFQGTDAINGFRAYRLDILKNPQIDIWQDWLDGYSLETYLFYKILKLGYRVKEVPVTKSYSSFKNRKKYSHIRPIVDWWDIFKPLIYLKIKIKS
jgi:dolichol-phosphate mannosyltransferase